MVVDWFLILVIVIMTLAFVGVNVYLLIYFQHPEDHNTAYFPKFVVVLGLLLAEACVLLLPLDVANRSTALGCSEGWNPFCGGLNMEFFWLFVFLSIVVVLVVILPFTIFYYEADDSSLSRHVPQRYHQVQEASKMAILTLCCVTLVIVLAFSYLAKTAIPVTTIHRATLLSSPAWTVHEPVSAAEITQAQIQSVVDLDTVMEMDMSFPIFLIALLSFIGWFAFVIFGGIGLVAVPCDAFHAFFHRPKFMPSDVYATHKLQIKERTLALLTMGQNLQHELEGQEPAFKKEKKRKISSNFWTKRQVQHKRRLAFRQLRQSVYVLEQDFEELQRCHDHFREYNPLWAWSALGAGVLSLVLSLGWLVQIITMTDIVDDLLSRQSPQGGFLSPYFMSFDRWFPLFGTISVGVFTFYLFAAVIKGCLKFGLRCFCCALHPMKLHGTYMNSFLFNLGLILMCCFPVVQFADMAFRDYTRLTTLQTIMGTQVRYCRFFRYFWQSSAFLYGILAIMTLTLIILLLTSKEAKHNQLLHQLQARLGQHTNREP